MRLPTQMLHHGNYTFLENYTSQNESPQGELCSEEPDRRCHKHVNVADANVCSAFRMHVGHPTPANPQGDVVSGTAGLNAQTCRLSWEFFNQQLQAILCEPRILEQELEIHVIVQKGFFSRSPSKC